MKANAELQSNPTRLISVLGFVMDFFFQGSKKSQEGPGIIRSETCEIRRENGKDEKLITVKSFDTHGYDIFIP
jgi:hypothetical protein